MNKTKFMENVKRNGSLENVIYAMVHQQERHRPAKSDQEAFDRKCRLQALFMILNDRGASLAYAMPGNKVVCLSTQTILGETEDRLESGKIYTVKNNCFYGSFPCQFRLVETEGYFAIGHFELLESEMKSFEDCVEQFNTHGGNFDADFYEALEMLRESNARGKEKYQKRVEGYRNFKKSSLKTGDILQLRDGSLGVYVRELGGLIYQKHGFEPIGTWSEDLLGANKEWLDDENEQTDVMFVYRGKICAPEEKIGFGELDEAEIVFDREAIKEQQ